MSTTSFEGSAATTQSPHLSPAQLEALTRLQEAVRTTNFTLLEGSPGSGKSTVLRELVRLTGGVRISGRELTQATADSPNTCIDEQVHALLEERLRRYDLVVVDDFDHLIRLSYYSTGYRRPEFLGVALRSIIDLARDSRKHLILVGDTFRHSPEAHMVPDLAARAASLEMPPMRGRDFLYFLEIVLGDRAREVDAERVYQYAPGLNGYQLLQIGRILEGSDDLSEDRVREVIDSHILRSNLRPEEVASITFDDLKGFEHIVDKLTTYLINPLQQDQRFDALQLKPKRGVLLYGPPGTGKTSIGRALARQMRGKFFMIDGTIPPEPAADFFARVKLVFEAAKSATPSVIFIDDADVLFQSDRSTSFNRYLLTMLDGLESATAGKVAVMMTAMDPNHLPAALLRSGRVELWLETTAPAAATRGDILAAHVARLPPMFRDFDVEQVTAITEGFNAADMRRVVADVKALFAADIVERREPRTADSYFEVAARNVRRNKELLSLAEVGAFNFSTRAADTGGRTHAPR
jgi:AAA+ superfamily predicted ATPase/energy-coupling factor transporter ATP-binding protein EcfA2